jgi:LacI family transcriptional regulator
VDEQLIATSVEVKQHGFTQDSGYAAMAALLQLDERPDAVFAASDDQAFGALRAIRETGLKVPEDIAVIGFDDLRMSAHVGLSTLSQPMYEMGRVGIDKVIQRIAEPERPVSRTSFSAQLIARKTTGACPLSDAPPESSPVAVPRSAPLSRA